MVRARIEAVDLRRPDLRKPFPRRFVKRLTGQTCHRADKARQVPGGGTVVRRDAADAPGHVGIVPRGARRRGTRSGAPTVDTGRRPRSRRLSHVVGKGGRLQRPAPFRRDGSDSGRRTARIIRPWAGSARSRCPTTSTPRRWRGRAAARRRRSRRRCWINEWWRDSGNIYASEALHVAGLSPRRQASILATPAGAPRDAAYRLAAAIKQVLEKAIARQSDAGYRDSTGSSSTTGRTNRAGRRTAAARFAAARRVDGRPFTARCASARASSICHVCPALAGLARSALSRTLSQVRLKADTTYS